jgi:hypothetical protein
MLLKMFPIAGPSNARITITTTATKTRIKAYSTRPCPFSFGANNIRIFSFLKKLVYLKNYYIFEI